MKLEIRTHIRKTATGQAYSRLLVIDGQAVATLARNIRTERQARAVLKGSHGK